MLLFGSGAIGTVYLHLMLQAGCDVTAICRSNYTAAKDSGFHIDSGLYGNGIHIRPKVVRTPTEAASTGPYDYLIVTCKAIPEAQTSETIAPAITQGKTTIVLIQNGIDIEQEYASKFPHNPLLTCVVYLPTTQTSPGHVRMGGNESLEIGPHPTPSTALTTTLASGERLTSLLQTGGSNTHFYPTPALIQERRWYKLLLNATWNPICALTQSRDIPFLLSSTSSKPVLQGVMNEVLALSRAQNFTTITPQAAEASLQKILDRIGTKHIGVEPSMLADVLNKKGMEHEVILGNVVRKAKSLEIEVPRLEMLYALTKALDLSLRKRKGEGRSLDGEDLADLYPDFGEGSI